MSPGACARAARPPTRRYSTRCSSSTERIRSGSNGCGESVDTRRRSGATGVDLRQERSQLGGCVEPAAITRDRDVVVRRRLVSGELAGAFAPSDRLDIHVPSVRPDFRVEGRSRESPALTPSASMPRRCGPGVGGSTTTVPSSVRGWRRRDRNDVRRGRARGSVASIGDGTSKWWSNDRGDTGHVHAKAWLDAGRNVQIVDRSTRRVRYSASRWRRLPDQTEPGSGDGRAEHPDGEKWRQLACLPMSPRPREEPENPFSPGYGQVPPYLAGRDELISSSLEALRRGPGRSGYHQLVITLAVPARPPSSRSSPITPPTSTGPSSFGGRLAPDRSATQWRLDKRLRGGSCKPVGGELAPST